MDSKTLKAQQLATIRRNLRECPPDKRGYWLEMLKKLVKR